jgi:hypothetical protein
MAPVSGSRPSAFRSSAMSADFGEVLHEGHAVVVGRDQVEDFEVAVAGEVGQARRDLRPQLHDVGLNPGLRPREPAARTAFAAHDRQAEEVVEAAAVDPHDADVAAALEFGQRKGSVGGGGPIVGAAPAVGVQAEADFDVQVLGEEGLQLAAAGVLDLGEFVAQPLGVDRAAHVRVGDVEVRRVQIGLGLDHGLGNS